MFVLLLVDLIFLHSYEIPVSLVVGLLIVVTNPTLFSPGQGLTQTVREGQKGYSCLTFERPLNKGVNFTISVTI